MRRFAILCACALGAAACKPAPRAPIGYSNDPPPSDQAVSTRPEAPKVPDDVVARAAGPVTALRLPSSEQLAEGALARELLRADAICLGEEHDSAGHHYLEQWLVELLASRAAGPGYEIGVGFEMFQKPFQKTLSAYQRGSIDAETLLRDSEYAERWGFPFAYYRPVLEAARQARLALVALNARRELTRSVAKKGLDGLDRAEERELPALDLDQAEHRARFERDMQNHPGLDRDQLDRYYAAQVVWDETMAEQGARWLANHAPIRRLVILAGRAHCQRTAIPARLERRGVPSAVAVLLATEPPPDELKGDFDYALIVGKPE